MDIQEITGSDQDAGLIRSMSTKVGSPEDSKELEISKKRFSSVIPTVKKEEEEDGSKKTKIVTHISRKSEK